MPIVNKKQQKQGDTNCGTSQTLTITLCYDQITRVSGCSTTVYLSIVLKNTPGLYFTACELFFIT